MSETIVPRRSALYMPASNERALEKAKTIAADALILDCEDAVAPDAKPQARENAAAVIANAGEYGRKELTIRVNGLDTPWGADDIASAAKAGPAAIVVPKVSSVADVAAIEKAMEAGGAPDHTALWVLLETPQAMEAAFAICSASERLQVLIMGTNDLAKELRASLVPGRGPLLWGLGRCLNAARATGKVILDGVYNDIKDEEGFVAECRQGFEMGFDGKTLIHPAQVDPCNGVWAPTEAQIELAQRTIEAFDAAVAEGKGVVTLDGRMIENLHVDNARRVLAVAAAIAG